MADTPDSTKQRLFKQLIRRSFTPNATKTIWQPLIRLAGTWSAVPFPSSIGLYQKGQGYPKFDQKKADEYYKKVTDKVANLVNEIVKKWDLAGL